MRLRRLVFVATCEAAGCDVTEGCIWMISDFRATLTWKEKNERCVKENISCPTGKLGSFIDMLRVLLIGKSSP
jgi:hypothetical protein